MNNCVKSKILPGIQSDHSVVFIQFNDNQPLRGRGYWKLNCSYLHHDTDFVNLIKDRIKEFKQIHKDSECNPNTLWDSLKCTITGISIEYSTREKKERNKEKVQLRYDIDKIKSLLTLYLPHFESQYLVHLQILIKIAQETLSFHTYMV